MSETVSKRRAADRIGRLTDREIFLIDQAIRIGIEDGSLYGAAGGDDSPEAVDAELGALRRKLGIA